MILRVNPNRMELIRLRKRLSLAQRGHKLLQDKLEQMMYRFLSLLKDIDKAKDDFGIRMQDISKDLIYCRIMSSKKDFEKSLSLVDFKINLSVLMMRIMNIKVPVFTVKELTVEKRYDFFNTSAQMDLAVAKGPDYIRSLSKLAQLLKTADILSSEIERTRRRVNALEYILIPSIQQTIASINQKLNELERASLTRLMRIKEML